MFTTEELETIAKQCRDTAIEMSASCGSGHLGGSLSVMDILVVLYFKVMKKGDVVVLSKAHCSEAMYAVLFHKGVVHEDELKTFGEWGSRLQGHCEHAHIPEITFSGGSLGQGLSFACGIAEAKKRKKEEGRVFCILGDGECHEGQIWEAAMFAGDRGLNNLIAIVDNNKYTCASYPIDIDKILTIKPIGLKWSAFNWDWDYCDGHSITDLSYFLGANNRGSPFCIIAETIKGKGSWVLEKTHSHLSYGKELDDVVKEWRGNAT